MKRIFFAMAIAVMAISVSARDRLYITDFSIAPGESKTISVLLDNDTTYCALQTDIILPEGLTIDMDDDEYIIDLTSRKSPDHVVSTNRLVDGSIRVFVSSQNSRPFNGNSGAILTIDVTAASSFEKGNIILTNSVLVEEDGTRHRLADETAKVNGGSITVIPGDVNGDGVVTAADITSLYDYLLNGDTTFLNTLDVNGDGEITAADVTAIYDILLVN